MTQPVLYKQSFLIAVLAGMQAVMPAVVAVVAGALAVERRPERATVKA